MEREQGISKEVGYVKPSLRKQRGENPTITVSSFLRQVFKVVLGTERTRGGENQNLSSRDLGGVAGVP